ncbi:unnamed protein product [Linum tenue]|uniref:Formin-like protein 18 n=1 Tax=Linum tenue TaxID=586396 RepID=A0AAV0QF60_9ROSI|nr:unnamed protein product [Linum tenue]
MDPCPFVRLIIESLSLKLPFAATKPAGSGVHPTATPCFCVLKLKGFPTQTALLPLCPSPPTTDSSSSSAPETTTSAPGFHLDAAALRRVSGKPIPLRVSVYTGGMGRNCGVSGGRLLGKLQLKLDLGDEKENAANSGSRSGTNVFQNGWLTLRCQPGKPAARIHMVCRAEPDPRFVFQFGGEPECSPVVFQIQGCIRQPVFSCKFSADRNSRSRSLPSDFNNASSNGTWTKTFSTREREKASRRERKGWMITIHDLSGSPVAAASMITPFVPSPGSDRVSRSNPGAWLILRPHGFSVSTWKPWGRLEAWRERGGAVDGLGYKFELMTDSNGGRVAIAEGSVGVRKGGRFDIDGRTVREPVSRSGSAKGFVMGSTVEGEGKVSRPVVQVGVQHVTCTGDAALFVALSAAVDLSMDACRLFSSKLRKELCHDDQDGL